MITKYKNYIILFIVTALIITGMVIYFNSCNKPTQTDNSMLDSLKAVIYKQADSLKNKAIGDTVYIHQLDSLRNPEPKLKIIYIKEREKEHTILNGNIDTAYYLQQLDSLTN